MAPVLGPSCRDSLCSCLSRAPRPPVLASLRGRGAQHWGRPSAAGAGGPGQRRDGGSRGRSRASEPVPGPARMRRPDRQRQPCCPHDGLQKTALVSGAVAAACGEATCSRDSHLLPFTPPALSTSAPSSCDKRPRLQHTCWLPVPTPVRVSGPPHVVNNPIADRAEGTEMVHKFIPNEPWLP